MLLRNLRVGTRLQAKVDHYPARAGAVGTVRYLRPGLLYAVVEWDRPEANLVAERMTELSLRDLEHFETVAGGQRA